MINKIPLNSISKYRFAITSLPSRNRQNISNYRCLRKGIHTHQISSFNHDKTNINSLLIPFCLIRTSSSNYLYSVKSGNISGHRFISGQNHGNHHKNNKILVGTAALITILGLSAGGYYIYDTFFSNKTYPTEVKNHLRRALMGRRTAAPFEHVESEFLKALDACRETGLLESNIAVIGIHETLAEYYHEQGKIEYSILSYLEACVGLLKSTSSALSYSDGSLSNNNNNSNSSDTSLSQDNKDRIKRCLGNLYHIGFILESAGLHQEALAVREWAMKQSIGVWESVHQLLENLSRTFGPTHQQDQVQMKFQELMVLTKDSTSSKWILPEPLSFDDSLFDSYDGSIDQNGQAPVKSKSQQKQQLQLSFKPLDWIDFNEFVCFTSALASSYSQLKQHDVALALYFKALTLLTEANPKNKNFGIENKNRQNNGSSLDHDLVSKLSLRLSEEFFSIGLKEKSEYWTKAALDHRRMYLESLDESSQTTAGHAQEDATEFYYSLGQIQEKTRQFREALSSYKKAYKATPKEDFETRNVIKKSLKRVHARIKS